MYLSLFKDIVTVGLVAYFLLSGGGGILALLIISIGTTALCLSISVFIIIRQLGFCLPRFSAIRGLKSYFQVGFPLFIAGYGYWMIHAADRYVIGYFMDIGAVGIYSAAYVICDIIIALSVPMYFLLLRTISRLWDNG
jgi:O-antigen/teichoic acid export membrane protein